MTENDRIAARYPKSSPLDVLLGVAVGIGVVGMIALVILNALEQSSPSVAAMVRDFRVISSTDMFTRIVVQREDPSREAQCRVYAQAESFEIVAEKMVRVPPSDSLLSTVDVRLSTIKEATSVSVDQCSLTG